MSFFYRKVLGDHLQMYSNAYDSCPFAFSMVMNQNMLFQRTDVSERENDVTSPELIMTLKCLENEGLLAVFPLFYNI